MDIHGHDFFDCESTSDLIDALATIYDRKTAAQPLTLYTTFYDLSVLHNLSSESEMRHSGASGGEGLFLLFLRNCEFETSSVRNSLRLGYIKRVPVRIIWFRVSQHELNFDHSSDP